MNENIYRSQNLEYKRQKNSWVVRQLATNKVVNFTIDEVGNLTFSTFENGFPYVESLEVIAALMKDVRLCVICNQKDKVNKIMEKTESFRKVPTKGVSTRIYYSKNCTD